MPLLSPSLSRQRQDRAHRLQGSASFIWSVCAEEPAGPTRLKKNKKQNLKYFLFLVWKSFFVLQRGHKDWSQKYAHFRFRSGENVSWIFHVNHADNVQYLLRCLRWYIRRRLQLPLPLWTDTEVMKTQSGPLRGTPAAELKLINNFGNLFLRRTEHRPLESASLAGLRWQVWYIFRFNTDVHTQSSRSGLHRC